MITYQYNPAFHPPAPLVHVTLRKPSGTERIEQFPALLDCAADRTVIPLHLTDEPALAYLDVIEIEGYGGNVSREPSFVVEISIRDLRSLTLEVVANADERLVIVGRDIMNHHRIVLDGPRLKAEIE